MTEYTWISESTQWGEVNEKQHSDLCGLAEAWLTENEGPELSITVRVARPGEVSGTFDERGYPLRPGDDDYEAVFDLTNQAWEHALSVY
jgi:hypothetical protein